MKAERFSLSAEQAAKTLSEVHRNEDARDLNPLLNDLAQRWTLLERRLLGGQIQCRKRHLTTSCHLSSLTARKLKPAAEPSTGLILTSQNFAQKSHNFGPSLRPHSSKQSRHNQAFAGAAQQIADVALSSVLANFPELQGVSGSRAADSAFVHPEKRPCKSPSDSKPAPAGECRLSAAHSERRQSGAAGTTSNSRLVRNSKMLPLKTRPRTEIRKLLRRPLRKLWTSPRPKEYSQEALVQLWQTNPVLRSAPFQLLLLDAAKYRMAQRTAMTNRAPHSLPSVQRPGVASSAGERSTVDLSDLRDQFRKASGNDQLRAAVKLQQAQRRARG